MNLFDFIVIGFVAAGSIYGLRQGLLQMVTAAIALLAAIYVASVYYIAAGTLAQHNFGADPTVAAVIGYLAIFVVVFSVIQVIGMTAVRLIHIVHLGWIDRLAGSMVGASMVAVSAGIAVMLLAAVLPANAELLTGSRLAPMLIAYDNALVDYIPQQAKEAYEQNRDTLMRDWIARAEKAIAESSASPQATPSKGGATDTR
jgi:membrane protein required for colicin V production